MRFQRIPEKVPVRTSVDLPRHEEKNNELYQLKVDVGTVKYRLVWQQKTPSGYKPPSLVALN